MQEMIFQKVLSKKGFTFVEILIVVVMIGILAMMIVPKIASTSDEARESALATDLKMLRRHIGLYKADHNGRAIHYDNLGIRGPADLIKKRLLEKTATNGKLIDSGEHGPYLRIWPSNPFADSAQKTTLNMGRNTIPPRDGSSGWYYSHRSQKIHPNTEKGALDLD